MCHWLTLIKQLSRFRSLQANIQSWLYFISAEHRSKFELERKDTEPYNPSSAHMGNPHHQQNHPPPLLPLPLPQHQFPSSGSPAVPNAVTVVAPAHLPDSTTESWSTYFNNHTDGKTFNKSSTLKHRCRDYDGKTQFTLACVWRGYGAWVTFTRLFQSVLVIKAFKMYFCLLK